jgi:hypothetical protein
MKIKIIKEKKLTNIIGSDLTVNEKIVGKCIRYNKISGEAIYDIFDRDYMNLLLNNIKKIV